MEIKQEILSYFQENHHIFGDKILEENLKTSFHLTEEEIKIYEAVVLNELGFDSDFVFLNTNVKMKVKRIEEEDGTDVYIVLYSINGTHLRTIIENYI